MQREPNTKYVLSLSYGKDSLACLGAIKELRYPLDMIVHAEVWATDDIPADLPPMVDFKKQADKIIREQYGLEVVHICATRERERELHTSNTSIVKLNQEATSERFMDFPVSSEVGVTQDSKCKHSQKLTYEKQFYEIPKRKQGLRTQGTYRGFPMINGNWCTALKTRCFQKAPLHKERI